MIHIIGTQRSVLALLILCTPTEQLMDSRVEDEDVDKQAMQQVPDRVVNLKRRRALGEAGALPVGVAGFAEAAG